MPTESTTPLEVLIQVEEFIEYQKPPTKKRKQVFHRAIKRNYQRQNFYQKNR